MPTPSHPPPAAGLNLHDLLYILFRHKWKIVFCSILGLAGATALHFTATPIYECTAKLLVRYVMDSRAGDTAGANQQIRTPDSRGDNIINSEIEIMTSWDLALDVAQNVGPARILGPGADQTNRNAAAGQILRNLQVTVPRNSNVILVSLKHSDPEIARVALNELITRYLEKHLEVHRAIGAHEFLRRQTDLLRSRLSATEDQLQQIKRDGRIISLDDSKRDVATTIGRLQQAILEEEAQLAGHRARLEELERWAPARPATTATNGTVQPTPLDPAIVEHYQVIVGRLASLQQSEFALLGTYTADHSQVQLLRRQIETVRTEKRQLEAEHPDLLISATPRTASGEVARNSLVDPMADRAFIAGAEARLTTLRSQLDTVLAEATRLDSMEKSIVDLQRRRDTDEQNFRYFAESLEKARIDEALDPSRIPNISRVQDALMPIRVTSDLRKHMAMIAALGIALGVGLAFLIDLVLDPSIKRPLEIESRLRIPLMLSIPLVARNGHTRLLAAPAKPKHRKRRHRRLFPKFLYPSVPPPYYPRRPRPSPPASPTSDLPSPSIDRRAPWELSHFIRPYCEALRDRLILYFQLKEVHHKPKLVAVTGCSDGSGVTTIAAGLAAALSETGDGKVLLVDMNVGTTELHPFYKGQLVAGLAELLDPVENGARPAAVGDNLFVASATGQNGHAQPLIPKKFYDLMPRLKASDFDYIIFDMPPVNQTSATMALAGFMDQVFLVVEGDKTSHAHVKRAHSVLTSVQANVAGIFNKSRTHAPAWLEQDV